MSKPLLFLFLVLSTNAVAQDSLVIKEFTANASKNYDRINRSVWQLTRDIVTSDSSPAGTQISYQYDKDELIRIVCSGFNELGAWAKEYYPANGELAFVYATTEYFPNKAPKTAVMNWKNLPSTEYRIYFSKGKLIGEKPDSWKGNVSQIMSEFDALLKRSR